MLPVSESVFCAGAALGGEEISSVVAVLAAVFFIRVLFPRERNHDVSRNNLDAARLHAH